MPEPVKEFEDETRRLGVIESFEAEALEDDPELQAIVEFAARLCGAPVSMVTLLEQDRQRFLAREGLDQRETPRDVAFCNHTIGKPDLFEVVDAQNDPRFASNPLVTDPPQVRYYAGQPLVSEEGASLGTLCVIDTEAHAAPLDDFQREGLSVLAKAAIRRLETRRASIEAKRIIAEREERLLRMIEGVPQIAWSADENGNFDYFNNRWQEVTGASPPRTAEDWAEFIHEDDHGKAFDEWNRSFAAAEEFEAEFRFRRKDGTWMWVLGQAVPVSQREGEPLRWFGTVTDIDEVRRALEERDLLAKELSHRIKNIFAVVIGLATLKARKAPEHQPFAQELTRVLQSLGRAHEFVRPNAGPMQDSLTGLLEALFIPYGTEGEAPRVRVSGVDAAIGPSAATPLALVFHELATNSAKYGALSTDDGHIDLVAREESETIELTWTEHGSPPSSELVENGFGSRLIDMSMKGQLQGSWERRFEDEGLVVELTMAKAALNN
ncbi:sensor histidine kinase [Aurantiacibacter poecillastricola]|uniref:sensor histidine kinase n=1 Tax=Aurantiacibacter poecillastricola TaxID=3064385 RepID=UPI00273E9E80|nr:PAS domain-containing protein [Aurantiacibacter sp. 219JJ12-13]MDP5260787.1 PAS domain-containing protein [Aurantiacibacter sp. 219JJ12-13]